MLGIVSDATRSKNETNAELSVLALVGIPSVPAGLNRQQLRYDQVNFSPICCHACSVLHLVSETKFYTHAIKHEKCRHRVMQQELSKVQAVWF